MGMDRPIGVPVKADASLPGFRSNKALLFKAGNQSVSHGFGAVGPWGFDGGHGRSYGSHAPFCCHFCCWERFHFESS